MNRGRSEPEWVTVPVEDVLCETERAFLVSVYGVGVWLPYSQVKDPDTCFDGPGPYTLQVTRWVASRNGIIMSAPDLAVLREFTRNAPPVSCLHCQRYLTGLRHALVLAEQSRLRVQQLEAENQALRAALRAVVDGAGAAPAVGDLAVYVPNSAIREARRLLGGP